MNGSNVEVSCSNFQNPHHSQKSNLFFMCGSFLHFRPWRMCSFLPTSNFEEGNANDDDILLPVTLRRLWKKTRKEKRGCRKLYSRFVENFTCIFEQFPRQLFIIITRNNLGFHKIFTAFHYVKRKIGARANPHLHTSFTHANTLAQDIVGYYFHRKPIFRESHSPMAWRNVDDVLIKAALLRRK